MQKGISIYFSPDDLAELQEFVVWKTHKAAAGKFASIDSNFDLREAADLIRQAKIDKQHILRDIERQRGAEKELDQQRENISLLPDRETEAIQSEWRQQAKQQAESYAAATNSGKRLRSGEDKDIRDGVLSWLKRQKLRGNFGGRKTLDKN